MDDIHQDVEDVDEHEALRSWSCSPNSCGHHQDRLLSSVEEVCEGGIVLAKLAEEGLFLAIAEARKREILESISPEQHVQLWLDVLRLTIYAYPDPYAENSDIRIRQCCRSLVTSTILPFLSILDWQHLQILPPR